MFLYKVGTQELFQKRKIWGLSLLKKHSQFLIFNKVFYCYMAKPGANNRKVLENIFPQKLLRERKL